MIKTLNLDYSRRGRFVKREISRVAGVTDMNETVLSDLPARPYLTLTTICGVGSLMIPILQTKNPKLREVK